MKKIKKIIVTTIVIVPLLVLLAVACLNPEQPASTESKPPQPEVSGVPANSEQQGKAFSISTEAHYQATLHSNASLGNIIDLSLTPKHRAKMVTNYLDNSKSARDTGEWTTLNNGNLMLNLRRVDEKDTMTLEFKTDGEKLIYTGTKYGAEGLIFWVKPVQESK